MKLAAEQLDALVAEVLKRLAAHEAAPAAGSAPAAAGSRQAAATDAAASPPGVLRLEERLLTWTGLKDRLAGVRQVQVSANCVVTPAAQDGLRGLGVELQRSGRKTGSPGARLVIALGAADVDVGGLQGPLANSFAKIDVLRETDPVQLVNRAAAMSGSSACVAVVTRQPATVMILANRRRTVRAVQAVREGSWTEILAATGANWAVVDPTGRSELELVQLLSALAGQAAVASPPALR